jgi:hypothetical protein
MSLAALRSSSKNMLNKIHESNAKAASGGSRAQDERIWKPTFDKERGTGTATIRFLPPCAAEVNELPYLKIHSHAFQGPTGKWYIEKSLSTLGLRNDPVGRLNSALWNSGIESDKEICRNQKRQTKYYANILVIKDPAHPENEGKVKIYEYGPGIAKLLEEAAFPTAEFEGETPAEPLNPFDVDNGAELVIRMVGHKMKNSRGADIVVPNYDKTSFKDRSALCGGDDAKIEEVWNKCYPLKSLISDDQFKSVEALQARLVEVLGPVVGSGVSTIGGIEHVSEPEEKAPPKATTQKSPRANNTKPAVVAAVDKGDDDDFSFLNDID